MIALLVAGDDLLFKYLHLSVVVCYAALGHEFGVQNGIEGPFLHKELLVVAIVDRREDAFEALTATELHLGILADVFLLFT